MYDGGWKDKAADGYGVMKWQNGDRLVVIKLNEITLIALTLTTLNDITLISSPKKQDGHHQAHFDHHRFSHHGQVRG